MDRAGAAKQKYNAGVLESVTSALAKSGFGIMDANVLLQEIESDISLMRAVFYTDYTCI